MDDSTIHERIEQLVDEEHELWHRQTDGDIDDATKRRLLELQVALDQMWDLLRQREGAAARPPRPGQGGGQAGRDRGELPPVDRRVSRQPLPHRRPAAACPERDPRSG